MSYQRGDTKLTGKKTEHKFSTNKQRYEKFLQISDYPYCPHLVGGVENTFSASAAEVYDEKTGETCDVLELTTTILRQVTSTVYGDQYEEIDWTDGVWKEGKDFLFEQGTGTLNTGMLRFIGSNGNFIDPYNLDYNKQTDPFPCDGWFEEDGTPVKWTQTNGSYAICVKFYQALNPDNYGKYKYLITDIFTDLNDKTYSVKWVIVNPDSKKAVIYTFNVVYHTEHDKKSYNHSLKVGNTPNLWGAFGEDGVIQMYMGGWKYQTGSELAKNNIYQHTSTNYKNNGDTGKRNDVDIKDGWEETSILTNYGADNVTYYQYYFVEDGTTYREKSYGEGRKPDNNTTNANARSEFLEENEPGKYMKKFAKRGNVFGKGNPFTVPCFGAFLKFEPEQNGTVTLYMVQNGIIDLSASGGDDGGLQPEPKWRPTYIVDELGNQLTDETGVTVELPRTRAESTDKTGAEAITDEEGQKIYIGSDGKSSVTLVADDIAKTNGQSKVDKFVRNIAAFEETVAGKVGRDVWNTLITEYWKTGGSEMKMMPPSASQDGWIAINKTYVKYTFPVKAGKSYYVFNNDSQIGYCGYKFQGEGILTETINIDDNNPEGYTPPAGSYRAVTINRSFKPGWNAICLPFSVTESKMRAVFGEDGKENYELVTYNGCRETSKEVDGVSTTENGLTAHFFRHAYQDIIAGYPYMIYIPEDAPVFNGQPVTFYDVTIENDIEMASFQSSVDYMDSDSHCSKKDISTIGDFVFKGTFVPENIPAGSYVVYGKGSDSEHPTKTGIRYLAQGDKINGLRSYLYPEYRYKDSKPVEAVARIAGTNFSEVLDESMWNDATVINGLMEEMGFFNQRENVYSVTGQIVRQNSTSLMGLPRGIYIVKGKKYFVK